MINKHSQFTGLRKLVAKRLRPAIKFMVQIHTAAEVNGYFNMKREVEEYLYLAEQLTKAMIKHEESIVKEQK